MHLLTLLVNALLFAATPPGSILPPPQAWAARVIASDDAPCWKRRCAMRLLEGDCYTAPVSLTRYSPLDSLDPGTGGGWCAAWGGRLTSGEVAADWHCWPPGTVFYAPGFDRSWVVTDSGPAVRGPRHLDVMCGCREEWDDFAETDCRKVWVLGRITRQELRGDD